MRNTFLRLFFSFENSNQPKLWPFHTTQTDTWISTLVKHWYTIIIRDVVVSGSFLAEVEDTEPWHAEPTVWPWVFEVVVVFSCRLVQASVLSSVSVERLTRIGKRYECQYLLAKHLLFDFWCSSEFQSVVKYWQFWLVSKLKHDLRNVFFTKTN